MVKHKKQKESVVLPDLFVLVKTFLRVFSFQSRRVCERSMQPLLKVTGFFLF